MGSRRKGETMSIINERQSIRKFNGDKVDPNLIPQLLEAAMAAPSSKNYQPWQFVVLDSKDLVEEFAAVHQGWKALGNADKHILVCGDFEKDKRETHILMACSAASQNILLKCTELGLGSVWMGLYPDPTRTQFTKERLGLPEHILPISLISIGHYDAAKPKKRAYKEEIVHYNGWQP